MIACVCGVLIAGGKLGVQPPVIIITTQFTFDTAHWGLAEILPHFLLYLKLSSRRGHTAPPKMQKNLSAAGRTPRTPSGPAVQVYP